MKNQSLYCLINFLLLFFSFTNSNAQKYTGTWKQVFIANVSGETYGRGITCDVKGNAYITGSFYSRNLGLDSIILSNNRYYNAFVAKLDSSGQYEWAINSEGNRVNSESITVDTKGNSYITGNFNDTAIFGSYKLIASSQYADGFVAKINKSGNWEWAVKVGGISPAAGICITVDAEGNSYVTGTFSYSATFDTITLNTSGKSMFVAKLDSTGQWQWAIHTDNNAYSVGGGGIALDSIGNIYVTGGFAGTTTFGNITLTSINPPPGIFVYITDIFIAKISNNGEWKWAIKAGGSYVDIGTKIDIGNRGNVYVTGYFQDTAYFGGRKLISSGKAEIFVAKLDSSGQWLWAVKSGGKSDDIGTDITVDGNGSAYITGSIMDTAIFDKTEVISNGMD